MNKPDLPPMVLIAGPTASGKSALALALAERHGGTIINADSAQVYRDLRVVTARPAPEEEARAPHRLFGHIDGADTGYSAARWAAEARAAVERAHAAGRLPLLVGGTGLYLRTLLDGIAPVPAIDPTVRREVRAMPSAEAHAALDPAAAAALHPHDTARVHRALEVLRSTGQPIAAWRAAREGGIGDRVRQMGVLLLPPRDWLDARIAARAEEIVRDGQTEVAALLARPDLPADAPIRRAIGVPELAALIAATMSEADAVNALTLATRQYAKRQFTWFRRQAPAGWLRLDSADQQTILTQIETMLRNNIVDAQPSSAYLAAPQQGTHP